MKKNLTTLILGLSLVAVPVTLANFVIGGNSSATGYGYGYGNCSTDGNGGYLYPCPSVGFAGYGYGAGGILGTGTTNTNSGGSSVVSNAYVLGGGGSMGMANNGMGLGTTNNLGLPQGAAPSTTGGVAGQCVGPFVEMGRPGKKGQVVVDLQVFLKKLGYFPASVATYPNYGPQTVKAVKAFQAAQGFAKYGPGYVSGLQLKLTNEALNAVYCAQAK